MARRSVTRLARHSAGPSGGLVTAARVVAAMVVYLALFFGASIALYALGTLLPSPIEGAFGIVSLGIAEGLALLGVVGIWLLVDRRPIAQLGLHPYRAPQRWLKGASVAALMMGFVVVVGYTLVDGARWDANPDTARAVLVLVVGLIGFGVQGPAEEVLFRGYVLENLRDQWGAAVAVLVSAAGFAFFHAANPAFGPLPLLNLFLFGVATALYRLRLDSYQLWGVFAIHAVWNWLQQVVFGLPNSGIASAPGNTLFTLTLPENLPAPFDGGGFGPEGTLWATLVLLALTAASLRRRRRGVLRTERYL